MPGPAANAQLCDSNVNPVSHTAASTLPRVMRKEGASSNKAAAGCVDEAVEWAAAAADAGTAASRCAASLSATAAQPL